MDLLISSAKDLPGTGLEILIDTLLIVCLASTAYIILCSKSVVSNHTLHFDRSISVIFNDVKAFIISVFVTLLTLPSVGIYFLYDQLSFPFLPCINKVVLTLITFFISIWSEYTVALPRPLSLPSSLKVIASLASNLLFSSYLAAEANNTFERFKFVAGRIPLGNVGSYALIE